MSIFHRISITGGRSSSPSCPCVRRLHPRPSIFTGGPFASPEFPGNLSQTAEGEGGCLDRRAEEAACTQSRSSGLTQQLYLGDTEIFFVYFVNSSENAFHFLCNVFVSLLCLAAPPTCTHL